ncbi:MAG: hypothetical protein MJ229_08105, partial [bacterium]|nr:hypothetical protein [bacterium]
MSCGNELLKLCPHCKGVNIPEATKCRKCGKPFEIKKTEEKIAEEKKKKKEIEKQKQEKAKNDLLIYDAKLFSQQNAKELLKKAFISENKKIISLNGENGIGKTIVLKTAINEFDSDERIWLVGECSPITQLSPCGLIQNILLTFFNIPNFCLDNLQLKKDSQRFFQNEFPTLTNDEVFRLLNFLYPKDTSFYENIFENKNKTFIMLEKVFRTIIESHKTVLIIENFDFIDGLSYELIHRLATSDFADANLKLLLTYSSKRPVQGYISSNYIKEDAYLNISLNVLEKEQINVFIDRFFDEEKKCPVSVKNKLAILSRGNAGVLEQYTSLLLDYKNQTNKFDIELPTTFNEVLKMRLSYLKEDMNVYKTLQVAAIQGVNFSPAIINEALQLQETHFFEILKTLQSLNYIVPVTQNVYAFKNTLLWKEIFEIIKLDENYYELNNNLISIFSEYTLSSNSIIAVMAQNIELYDEALEYWTQNTRLASYIGDTNLYTISQKQTLTFLDKTTSDKKELIENNIYERLGKLLSEISPEEAMGYLPKAINYSKNYTTPFKEIELTGYMAQCCKKVGNYNGILECIDCVLEKLDISQDLERAMVKSRKLDPLLKIGNCGELINLVDTDILPIFDKYISSKKHKIIPIEALYKSWLETYLYLAEALVFQGNNRSFEVIATLFELFEKNNFTDALFICKTKLALAFANTIKG